MKVAAITGPAAVVAALLAAAPARATVYDFTQLPLAAGGLNDLGQVVGTAPIPYAPGQATVVGNLPLLYDNGTTTPLFGSGSSSDFNYTFNGINNNGLVIYSSADVFGHSYGETDSQIGGGLNPNPYHFQTSDDVSILAVNNKGDVVGNSRSSAFTLMSGQSLNFAVPSAYQDVLYNETAATGINDLDQIVGNYHVGGFNPYTGIPPAAVGTKGFLLSGGVYSTITVPGALDTYPVAINNNGEIVGTFDDAIGVHGFEDENGVFSTITGPGGGDFLPVGLNNLGQLIGTTGLMQIPGDTALTLGPSYLATPQAVPEPSTLALLCAGLTGLLGWRSRTGKSRARR